MFYNSFCHDFYSELNQLSTYVVKSKQKQKHVVCTLCTCTVQYVSHVVYESSLLFTA